MTDTLEPLLRRWGEAAPPPPSPLRRELARFREELRTSFRGQQAQRFAELSRHEAYIGEYEVGYREGWRAGLAEAFREWLESVQRILTVLGLVIESYDPDQRGQPISPALRQSWIHVRTWLLALVPVVTAIHRQGFLAAVDLVAADKVKAMKAQGVAWVNMFYGLNGQPRAQGRHAGHMIGKASGDVLLSALEEVATAGAGRALSGTLTAAKIRGHTDRIKPGRARPHGVDEAIQEALAASHSHDVTKALEAAIAEPRQLAEHVRRQLGSGLALEVEAVLQSDAGSIVAKAKSLRRGALREAAFVLKGHIAERMYKNLPQFEALRASVGANLHARLKGLDAQWDGVVHFKEFVTALSPTKRVRKLELTDGMLVAFPLMDGRPVVLVLTVFESKSKTNLRHLVIDGREVAGEPLAWGGQFHKDYERLSELPLVIDGTTWQPADVGVSRRGTEWIAVMAADQDLPGYGQAELARQGFKVTSWHLSVTDRELNAASEAVLKAVRGGSGAPVGKGP